MILKELFLNNFRNYDELHIELHPNINIIYGNNAQGKTNLLESIYVLGLTKSHRLNVNDNLIKNGKDKCKIKGIVKDNNMKSTMEIILESKNKTLKIDDKEVKKVGDYIYSKLDIIIFYPEDLEIIKGSPILRRTFLNLELSQISNNYLAILNSYNKLLKIRNDYLKKMNKGEVIDEDYFYIVTKYLIDKMIIIYKMREKFIDEVNKSCETIFEDITKDKGFKLKYIKSFDIEITDSEEIRKQMLEIYKRNLKKEIKFGSTLFGLHRDDIEFYLGDKNLKEYGSQGQQRSAILSVKLAEVEILKKYKGTDPILLLDDVFSELDDIKKNNLVKYIYNGIQVIITTTDLHKINKKNFKSGRIFKIKDGEVKKLEEVSLDE